MFPSPSIRYFHSTSADGCPTVSYEDTVIAVIVDNTRPSLIVSKRVGFDENSVQVIHESSSSYFCSAIAGLVPDEGVCSRGQVVVMILF